MHRYPQRSVRTPRRVLLTAAGSAVLLAGAAHGIVAARPVSPGLLAVVGALLLRHTAELYGTWRRTRAETGADPRFVLSEAVLAARGPLLSAVIVATLAL